MAERRTGWTPTRQHILSLKSDLELLYAGRTSRRDAWREMLRDEIDILVPDDLRTTTVDIKLGLPRTFVRRTVQTVTAEPLRIKVPTPPDPTDYDMRAAARVSRWCNAALVQLERRNPLGIRRRLAHHQAVDGEGWLKLVFRPDAWHDKPGVSDLFEGHDALDALDADQLKEYNRRVANWKRGAPLPFAVRVPDPNTIFADFGEFGLDAVIEVSRRPRRDVMRMASALGGEPISTDDDRQTDDVEVLEYWDNDWQVVFANLKGSWRLLHRFKHAYGFIPYIHAPGWTEPTTNPKERYLSVLTPLEGMVSWLYTMLTAKGHRAWRTSYPTYQVDGFVGGEDDEDGSAKPFELEIGKAHPLEPGSDKGFFPIELPRYGGDLEETFGILAALMESSQIDAAAVGAGGGSGFAKALSAQLARVPFDQIADHQATAFAVLFARMLELVEYRVRDTVPIRFTEKDRQTVDWVAIGPDDTPGWFDVEVSIRPHDPMNAIANEQHYLNQWRGGFLPKRVALELANYENVEELMDERAWEDFVLQNPQFNAWFSEFAMVASGRGPRPMPQPTPQPTVLGPDGQPAFTPAEGGVLGGAPPGPRQPGVGLPVQGPANQPNENQVTVER